MKLVPRVVNKISVVHGLEFCGMLPDRFCSSNGSSTPVAYRCSTLFCVTDLFIMAGFYEFDEVPKYTLK